MAWHVLIDGEQKGPFEADTVTQMIGRGEVTPDTLVWTAGITDWTRAIDVPDLAAYFDGVAPPPQPLRYGSDIIEEEDAGRPGRLRFGRAFSDAFKGLGARPGNTFLIMAVYAALSVAISMPYLALVAPKIQTAMESPDQFDISVFGIADLGAYLLMAVFGLAFFGGLCATMLGLVRNDDVAVSRLFSGIPRLLPLIGFMILYIVLFVIGTALLVLPGVFVAVSLMFGMFIIMDRGAGAFAAAKGSFRVALRLGWFRVFGLILLLFLAIFAIFVVVGIGAAIWFAVQGGVPGGAAIDGAEITQSITFYVIQTVIGSVFGMVFVAILAAAYDQATPYLDAS